jgi:hypothetical protein
VVRSITSKLSNRKIFPLVRLYAHSIDYVVGNVDRLPNLFQLILNHSVSPQPPRPSACNTLFSSIDTLFSSIKACNKVQHEDSGVRFNENEEERGRTRKNLDHHNYQPKVPHAPC